MGNQSSEHRTIFLICVCTVPEECALWLHLSALNYISLHIGSVWDHHSRLLLQSTKGNKHLWWLLHDIHFWCLCYGKMNSSLNMTHGLSLHWGTGCSSDKCAVPGTRELLSLTILSTARCYCNGNITVLKVLRSDSSALVGFVESSPLRDWGMIIFGCVNKST